jgi:hypothetical protein
MQLTFFLQIAQNLLSEHSTHTAFAGALVKSKVLG